MSRRRLVLSMIAAAGTLLAGPVADTVSAAPAAPAATPQQAIAITADGSVVLLANPADPAGAVSTLATGLPRSNEAEAAYDEPGQRVFAGLCCKEGGIADTFEVPVGGAVDRTTAIVGSRPALSPDRSQLSRLLPNSVVVKDLPSGTEQSITFTEAAPLDVLWKDDATVYIASFSRSANRPVVATYTPAGEQLALHVIETVPLDALFTVTFAGVGPGVLSVLFAIDGQNSQLLGFDAETLQPTGPPVDLGGSIISLSLSATGQSLWVGGDQTLHVGDGAALPGQYRWAEWI